MVDKIQKQIVDLCGNLIQIKSVNPPGNERVLALYCQDILSDIGFDTEIINHSSRRASLIAMMKGGHKSRNFLFAGHLDTVPVGDESLWNHPPFSGDVSNGKIWGRGSTDMKGGIAALLLALKSLYRKKTKNTIVIALTADEECKSLGAKAILSYSEVKKSELLIIPEPTHNNIAVAEKGAIWIKVTTMGKSAHGAHPEEGINAINKMIDFCRQLNFNEFILENHPLLGKFSYSLNTLKGGIKTNIVPDRCELTIDIRTTPYQNQKSIIRSIEDTLRRIHCEDAQFKFRVKAILQYPPIETNPSNDLITNIISIAKNAGFDTQITGVSYYSDASIIVPKLKIPFLICGPGNPDIAHGINESLELSKLLDSYTFYKLLITHLSNSEF